VLLADVDLGGGVVADKNGREPDVAELSDLLLELLAEPGRERGPVHTGRHH
jgi:hypothetical protein